MTRHFMLYCGLQSLYGDVFVARVEGQGRPRLVKVDIGFQWKLLQQTSGKYPFSFDIQRLRYIRKSLEPSNETVGGGAKLFAFEAASDPKIGTIPLWKAVFESKSCDLLFDSTSFGRSGFILPRGFSDGANSEGFLLFCSRHKKSKKNEEPCEAARGDGAFKQNVHLLLENNQNWKYSGATQEGYFSCQSKAFGGEGSYAERQAERKNGGKKRFIVKNLQRPSLAYCGEKVAPTLR